MLSTISHTIDKTFCIRICKHLASLVTDFDHKHILGWAYYRKRESAKERWIFGEPGSVYSGNLPNHFKNLDLHKESHKEDNNTLNWNPGAEIEQVLFL